MPRLNAPLADFDKAVPATAALLSPKYTKKPLLATAKPVANLPAKPTAKPALKPELPKGKDPIPEKLIDAHVVIINPRADLM